ncbi:MAG: type II toxin-antitoxin system VapC family toxin [Anaerolineae bacterium]|nr:type II toxin-antitoxin system VapC family toxin [Anaerolineae bacterium]
MTKPDTQHSVLVDSDALVAWFYAQDVHHGQALTIFDRIRKQRLSTVIQSLVVAETAAFLSHRQGQPLARQFLAFASQLPVIHITEELQQEALALFASLEPQASSLVTCANVVVMRRFTIPLIFSFREVYTKEFKLSVAA